MSKRKRVSIQLAREEIEYLRSQCQEPEDLRLIMKLKAARERFGDRPAQAPEIREAERQSRTHLIVS